MEFWKNIFGKKEYSKNQIEDYYEVNLTEKSIIVNYPNRIAEQIDWSDIEEIKLVNTDEGPWLPDVWMILTGKCGGCSIPQGCEGFEQVYNIVSKYKGFNFESVINSASCTDNSFFELWKK